MTLKSWAQRYKQLRDPDFIIGDPGRPYLLRWFVIPRNRIFNIYLHEIIRSDDDRALHDHPWINLSVLIEGEYVEHTISKVGVHNRVRRSAGDIKLRRSVAAHRLEVDQPCTTLFITGPKIRTWGFHCPDVGWRKWQDFVGLNKGQVGRGCGE